MSNQLLTHSPGNWRPLLRLAGPVLAEETLTLMVTWTDWWLTGRFLTKGGDAVKAAMGLMGYTTWLIPSLFAAVAIGATAVVARRVGEGKIEEARLATNQAVLLGIGLSLLVTLACYLGGEHYIAAMNLSGEAAAFASTYLYTLVPVVPLIMFSQIGSACLRGAGDTVTGFVAKLIMVLVNVVVSTILVTGAFGLEPWGWLGIAVGTAVGHGLGGLVLLIALLVGRAQMQLSWKLMAPVGSVIRRLLVIGLPGGLDIAVLLGSQLIFVSIINSLGEAAAAAHGLAVQIEACAYLPTHAFEVAAATMTGQFLGAGRPQQASQSALRCLLLATVLIVFAGIAMFVAGPQLPAFFTGDPQDATTIQVAYLLRIIALALPSLAVVMVLSGALRGAGDTVWPFVFTLVGFLVVRIPLTLILAKSTVTIPWLEWQIQGAGWGVAGGWIAMAIDLLLRSFVIAARFFQGGWKLTRV